MSTDTLGTGSKFSRPLFSITPDDHPVDALLNASNLIKNLSTIQVIDPETFGGLLYALGDMVSEQALAIDDEQESTRHKLKKASKTASFSGVDVSCELSTIQQKLAFLYSSLVKHPATLDPAEVEGLGSVLADLQQEVSDIEHKLYP